MTRAMHKKRKKTRAMHFKKNVMNKTNEKTAYA